MKKLIVVMFALCAAFAAQAAYVDWQYSVSEAKADGNDLTSGYTAYLLTSSAWDGIKDNVTASALSGAATDSSAFYLAGSTKKNNIYSTGAGGSSGSRQVSADSGNYYVILSNGTGYNIALNNVSVTAYSDPTGAGTGQTPSITIDDGTPTLGTSITYTAFGGGGGSEPEPTSGLLMLVGLGVLGLRRKRK